MQEPVMLFTYLAAYGDITHGTLPIRQYFVTAM